MTLKFPNFTYSSPIDVSYWKFFFHRFFFVLNQTSGQVPDFYSVIFQIRIKMIRIGDAYVLSEHDEIELKLLNALNVKFKFFELVGLLIGIIREG